MNVHVVLTGVLKIQATKNIRSLGVSKTQCHNTVTGYSSETQMLCFNSEEIVLKYSRSIITVKEDKLS